MARAAGVRLHVHDVAAQVQLVNAKSLMAEALSRFLSDLPTPLPSECWSSMTPVRSTLDQINECRRYWLGVASNPHHIASAGNSTQNSAPPP
jgi:hypothetical protein